MKRSTDRILTTHVGSLPRPPDLLDLVQADGGALDQPKNAARLREAVRQIVEKQIALGIDVIDDGEYGKPSFVSYVNEPLGGIARGKIVSRVLWRDPRGVAPAPHGVHRPDHLSRPRAAWARHRQSQG